MSFLRIAILCSLLLTTAATATPNESKQQSACPPYLVKEITTGAYRTRWMEQSFSFGEYQYLLVGNTGFIDGYYSLWRTDGTPEGTIPLALYFEVLFCEESSTFWVADGDLYFRTYGPNCEGPDVFTTNGEADGTYQVPDLPENSIPVEGIVENSTEGLTPEVLEAMGFRTIINSTKFHFMDASENGLFFIAAREGEVFDYYDGVLFLWYSDGTEAGTRQAGTALTSYDLFTFPPIDAIVYQNRYFVSPESNDGDSLHTVEEAGQTFDVFLSADTNMSWDRPEGFTIYEDMLYFWALHDGAPMGLWRSDGSPKGTTLVKGNLRGPGPSSQGRSVVAGDRLFFSGDDSQYGRELWASDGSTEGTQLLRDIHPSGSSEPQHLTAFGSRLYFSADDGASGRELWLSDGAPWSTRQVKDILPGAASSNPKHLTPMQGILYFSATDETTASGLWRSDGTEAGTYQIAGEHPSGIREMVAMNGVLYFVAVNAQGDRELWTSDGTETGTAPMTPLNPDGPVHYRDLFYTHGNLFFTADDGVLGSELWRIPAATATPLLVADIDPEHHGSPGDFIVSGDRLFFSAVLRDMGRELWALDLACLCEDEDLPCLEADPEGEEPDARDYFEGLPREVLLQFHQLDADADGRLELTELYAFLEGWLQNDAAFPDPVAAFFAALLPEDGEAITVGLLHALAGGDGPIHGADRNADGRISLSELLRVVQLYNSGSYACAENPTATEDGYVPGPGNAGCIPHASDYQQQDWRISLSELLRLVQLYNSIAYEECATGEDGYCVQFSVD